MTARTRSRLVAAAAAFSLAASLAACADGAGADPRSTVVQTSSAATTTTEHDDADVTFAQMMIVHHEGAIEMAELAAATASTPQVRALAARIAAAQGPQIDRMKRWLDGWGEPQPADVEHGGMDHGGMSMDGMDQAGAMSDLRGLSGTEFDRRFLELMTAHHQGAVTMSEEELASGRNAEALALARSIIDDQTAEITEMTNLLHGL